MKLDGMEVIRREWIEKEQLREEKEEQWESEETEMDEHKGGKEWKEELDATLADSTYSQEDYSSARCYRLPARPQRSSLNGDTQQEHTYTPPFDLFLSFCSWWNLPFLTLFSSQNPS